MATTNWILCRTKSRRERYAVANVNRQGYKAYLPTYDDERGREQVLFPCYLFVDTKPHDCQFNLLQSTYGISSIVMTGDNPTFVPRNLVRDMKRAEKNGKIIVPPKFTKNQPVTIKGGWLNDQMGLYQGMSPEHRVCVLFDILGKKTIIEFREKQVIAA